LLRPKPGALAPGFAGHLQFTPEFKNGLIRIANGISVYGISKNALREVEIRVPNYDEQEQIAKMLLDLQAEILPLEDKRSKLNDMRQGMMQQLLTGRIRLK
jgi:type I restriction enzyme S subunit